MVQWIMDYSKKCLSRHVCAFPVSSENTARRRTTHSPHFDHVFCEHCSCKASNALGIHTSLFHTSRLSCPVFDGTNFFEGCNCDDFDEFTSHRPRISGITETKGGKGRAQLFKIVRYLRNSWCYGATCTQRALSRISVATMARSYVPYCM